MSVRPNKKGGYTVRWRDDEKRNRQRTFDRKIDAEEWDDEVRRLKQRGHLGRLDAGQITLSQFVNETMIPDVFSQRAPRTQTFYADLLSGHIIPDLGPLPLASITAKRLRRWQRDRLAAGAGRYALNRALVLVGQILQHAAEDGELETNVAKLVRKVDEEPSDAVVPLAPSSVERVLLHLEGRDRFLTELLAYAGLRPGEVWALRRKDFGRTIHVQRAVDGMGGLKSTKTKATRNVRMLPVLAESADAYLEQMDDKRPEALLFRVATPSGVATKEIMDNWRVDTYARAFAAAGVPYQRPYDLRHSYASLLLAEGRSIHYVAKQLGHDPSLTASTYGHVIAEFEDAVNIDPETVIRDARAAAEAAAAADAPAEGATRWAVRPPAARTGTTRGDAQTRRVSIVHAAAPDPTTLRGKTACGRPVGVGWARLSIDLFSTGTDDDGHPVELCTTCQRRVDAEQTHPAVRTDQPA